MSSRPVRWFVVAVAALIVVVAFVVNAMFTPRKRAVRPSAEVETATGTPTLTPASPRAERQQRSLPRVAGVRSEVRPDPSNSAANWGTDAELDPEALALWEQTQELDQEVLQPEDLEVEPPGPPLDLRTIPAYRAENVDADGNLN